MGNAPPPNQEEKRLIILLPSDLLEQLRQAAEEEDLSVSQVVRRAIRNELKSIANEKTKRVGLEELQEALGILYPNLQTNVSPLQALMTSLSSPKLAEKSSVLADRLNAIAQAKARERK